MQVTLSKWGNSYGIRLPKNIVQKFSLLLGGQMEISVEEEKIILQPKVYKKTYNLKELTQKIPKNYSPSEVFQETVGNEVW